MGAAAPDTASVDAILTATGIASLVARPSSDQLEVALRALGTQAVPLDAVRATLLRERAIQVLKTIGIESPARLVDSTINAHQRVASADNAGAAVLFPAVDPWATPVYGPDILNELEEVVRCFVVLSTEAAVAFALWILHTHAVDPAQITPRLAILSPTKRCGKSTMLKLLGALVRRPLAAATAGRQRCRGSSTTRHRGCVRGCRRSRRRRQRRTLKCSTRTSSLISATSSSIA